MRFIKISLIIPIFLAALALPLLTVNKVSAVDQQSKDAACEGIGLQPGETCDSDQAGGEVNTLIAAAVNILSWIVGVVAVFMIILGGFKYITANGDSNAISSAKTTIIYALVGLVVAAVAQGLVQFVLNKTIT